MRILALDIGGTAIKIGVINEKGEILQQDEIPTFAKQGGETLMNRILENISKYENIDRIGVSSAGQIEPKTGRVIYATDNLPGWTGMEIKKRIESVYGVPTAVENDVNAAAIGEAYYGAGKDRESFVCLTFGTGIGGAIIENRKIYRGAFGSAGEFGHMITHVGGRQCNCGSKGCYETYASTSALIQTVRDVFKLNNNIDGKLIFKQFPNKQWEYKTIVENWLQEVMVGLINLIHIFNPSLLVLGGGIMNQPYALDYINENLFDYIMPNYRKVKVKCATLGNTAGILGASIVAMGLE